MTPRMAVVDAGFAWASITPRTARRAPKAHYKTKRTRLMAEIEIADDVYDALRLPEGEREGALKAMLAVSLYREGVLSVGKARELAGVSEREFQRLLGEREVLRHYTQEELDEDLAYANR